MAGHRYVLACFSQEQKAAQGSYRAFIEKGMAQGRRMDLTGGGVIRSNKCWRPTRNESARPKGDNRILGDTNCGLRGLISSGFLNGCHRLSGLPGNEVLSPGKQRYRVKARSVLCFWAVRELGMTATALAKELSISQPAVNNAVSRGERIVREKGSAF